jgi:hypothetical protein
MSENEQTEKSEMSGDNIAEIYNRLRLMKKYKPSEDYVSYLLNFAKDYHTTTNVRQLENLYNKEERVFNKLEWKYRKKETMEKLEFENSSVVAALIEFDSVLNKMKYKPFEIKIVGGFALLQSKIARDENQYTDIDYIGKGFSEEISVVISQIADKFNLPHDFINNRIGSLEDLELVLGKLNFDKTIQLSVITIKVLDKMGLLKTKLLSVDTLLRFGESPREKDIYDIIEILKHLNITISEANGELEGIKISKQTWDFVAEQVGN